MPDGSRSFVTSSPDLDRVAVLFRAHFEFVRRVLRRCGVMEANLDDAVQEVFLVVHRRIDDFEGRSSETTWLYAVAVRVASTLRRSASREQARRERAGAQMHSGSEADPERELSRSEAAALLDRLLDELDTTKRTVFVLAELEGVPVPEIAQIMEANLRTTHSRLRLARKRFNDALQRHHAQESGRVRRSSVGTLARRAEPAPADPSRARAAWAGLAVRISEGAAPMSIAWTGAGVAATTSGFWLPFAVTVGLGVGGLGVAVVASPSPAAAPSQAPTSQRVIASGGGKSVARSASLEETEIVVPSQREGSEAVVSLKPAVPEPVVVRRPAQVKPPRRTPTAPAIETVESATLDAETTLLEAARADLRASKPSAALGVLDEHRTRFPNGLLAAERRATRVKALCQAGRAQDAQRVAGTNSSLRAIVSTACQ